MTNLSEENTAGSGAVAGLGVGPDGEPPKKKLKSYKQFLEDSGYPAIPAKSFTVQKRRKKYPKRPIDLT